MNYHYRVCRAETDAEEADALEVRRSVFVEEQGVPEALEIDGKDDEAAHVVAYRDAEDDSTPVGAGRLREIEDGVGKLERIAVLEPHRGEGIGSELVAELEAIADDRGLSMLTMHAQTPVEGMYRKLGYETTSDEFEEAGIPHVEMEKSLS
ncbi:GNAT family N-acetyltransferase [Halorussus lipolyticus]|uniref:GNAT family N-acetyltransferase n=1 Tax=Halorussus lipolyticus TaxID=3034024 RepID=UPI0023E7D4C2|nr:GNAT family N-acetyltransferase [Halorussus sp. DT80]